MLLALPSICYVDFDVCLPLAPHDYKHQLPCCICCKTWQTCHCCPTKISVVLIKLRPSRSVLVTCGHWWPHDISPWPSSGWYQVQNSLRHPICLSAYVTPAFLQQSPTHILIPTHLCAACQQSENWSAVLSCSQQYHGCLNVPCPSNTPWIPPICKTFGLRVNLSPFSRPLQTSHWHATSGVSKCKRQIQNWYSTTLVGKIRTLWIFTVS